MSTFEHDAMIYGSDDSLVAAVVPFLREGLMRGEGTVVATHDRNRDILVRALGSAADDVLFVPAGEVYRSPHAAIAAYDGVLDHFRRAGRPAVRAIGEVAYGDTEAEHEAWLRYEPIADTVFKDAALHVICPYDERALPGRLVEHARRTHPTLHQPDGRVRSPVFVDPVDVLRSLPDDITFDTARPADLLIEAAGVRVRDARLRLGAMLSSALPAERADEAVLAIAEALANGARHGTGPVTAAMWILDEAVVFRVRNDGPPIDDLCAGYRPPARSSTGGRGLWLARQLADGFAIEHDARGPTLSLAFLR